MASIDELRPQDLPDWNSASAYASGRSMIRHANHIVRMIADAGIEIDGKANWPNLSGHASILESHSRTLAKNAREYVSLFRPPRWLRVVLLRSQLRKLDKQLDDIRGGN